MTEDAKDYLIECLNPNAFDRTIRSLGAAALIEQGPGDYAMKEGYYVMRIFGDAGYIHYAIKAQGYGRIIKSLENLS